jgi:hypothetical protein
MTRQNPLLPKQDLSNLEMVPPVEVPAYLQLETAMSSKRARKPRNRTWERKNRASGYRVPLDLHRNAKEIQIHLESIATEYMTTTSNVAAACMGYAMHHIRSGKLTLTGRPRPDRRKLILHWREIPVGTPQEIVPARKNKKQQIRPQPLFLAYRWGADVDKQIRAISDQTGAPSGEVAVYLLGHALAAYRRGTLRLESESVVVANDVKPTWGGDI